MTLPKKTKGGWPGLILAKIRLISSNDLLSKNMKGEWTGLVLAKISQMTHSLRKKKGEETGPVLALSTKASISVPPTLISTSLYLIKPLTHLLRVGFTLCSCRANSIFLNVVLSNVPSISKNTPNVESLFSIAHSIRFTTVCKAVCADLED